MKRTRTFTCSIEGDTYSGKVRTTNPKIAAQKFAERAHMRGIVTTDGRGRGHAHCTVLVTDPKDAILTRWFVDASERWCYDAERAPSLLIFSAG